MVMAFRHKNIRYSMAAAPCLSPYVLFHSWAGVVGAVLTDKWITLAAVIGLWITIILNEAGLS